MFAYQGIIGLGWNVDTNFRVNIDGRYYGTSNPTVNGHDLDEQQLQRHAGPAVEVRRRGSAAAAAAAADRWRRRRSWCSSTGTARTCRHQALNTIKQAASAFKTKGNARITATGHTDTSGPEAYNMALSLRRANAVKDALVRDGVPAQAITVDRPRREGPAGARPRDGVREPQNRRVEIVIQ